MLSISKHQWLNNRFLNQGFLSAAAPLSLIVAVGVVTGEGIIHNKEEGRRPQPKAVRQLDLNLEFQPQQLYLFHAWQPDKYTFLWTVLCFQFLLYLHVIYHMLNLNSHLRSDQDSGILSFHSRTRELSPSKNNCIVGLYLYHYINIISFTINYIPLQRPTLTNTSWYSFPQFMRVSIAEHILTWYSKNL